MKAKKILGLLLAVTMVVGTLAGCGDGGNDPSGGDNPTQQGGGQTGGNTDDGSGTGGGGETANTTPFYMTLDPNVTGEIDIMTWSGDSMYHADMGHWDPDPETELTSGNVAMVYAMAKKFNEMYPNVKINLYAKAGSGDDNDVPWTQELENFKAEHGKYPDIYCSMMLPSDISKGMVADLSVYADDPMYQSFNKSIMDMMNYNGMQAGLPQYLIPWGVYVNKELAETNNIDVPDPDWTIDEYTDFITSADNKTFWGVIWGDAATKFIGTGTDTVNAALIEGKEFNIASDQVMSLLDYIPKWNTTEIWAQRNSEAVPDEIMDDGWWWSYRFFCRNYVLTEPGDPWFFNVAALGPNEDGTYSENVIESNDWDIYPRPSTDYRGNNVGIVIDPMALRNYAMDDGDPALSDSEKEAMDLAYAFGSYWCGSTDAMQARADQVYYDNGVAKYALNDSFPLVTGEEFDKQMEIWYNGGGHERFADEKLMPGFQYVLELWEQGAIYDFSDKCYPIFVTEDGTQKNALDEWNNMTNSAVSGVLETDPNWLDTIKANLPEWNEKIKARLAKAQEDLKNGLSTYYGK